MMMKNRINVDGKVYQKTLQFGNRKSKVVYKNRKAYSRKPKHKDNFSLN